MGFGRGKVILLGEHAVVHGYPAIAAGIERGVTATARPGTEDELYIAPWELTVTPNDERQELLGRAFSVALGAYPERPPFQVEMQVDLPAGAGVGCSAAMGVALFDSIDESLGVRRSRADLGALALQWEKVFHGDPSGIDNTMSALGGVALYRKGSTIRAIRGKAPLRLIVGYSGEPSSTKAMVSSVARQVESDPGRMRKDFEAIEVLVRNATLAIESDDTVALGQLLDLNHAILSSWMLCTTKLDEMCQTARREGALGAKVTGAGGGGCMIALVKGDGEAERVRLALGSEAFVAEVGA